MNCSYSVDIMKKASFIDELINNLQVLPVEEITEETLIVIEYFKKRIEEIDKRYKN